MPGHGIRKCYNCHVAEVEADNFSTSKCERAGYVPIKVGGFLGIGGEPGEKKCDVCWNDPEETRVDPMLEVPDRSTSCSETPTEVSGRDARKGHAKTPV